MELTLENPSFGWKELIRERTVFANQLIKNGLDIHKIQLKGDDLSFLSSGKMRIAIIGSRDIGPREIEHVRRIVKTLAEKYDRPIIISGLAYGVDAAAHAAALNNGCPTIAVMATGLDTVYPYQNRELAKKIEEGGGCLLTQFEEGTAPVAINFLHRNALIALMSDVVIVVASKKKGGAVVTARFAYDFDVPVFAIPGDPDDRRHLGCNTLIQQSVANIIADLDDFTV